MVLMASHYPYLVTKRCYACRCSGLAEPPISADGKIDSLSNSVDG
ncbi:hypothetical protein BIFDEN_00125 [Bifidobacterium dentium ATCC 27678]|nr:hypothetical protein BIFDEN_00125 [Bifidobacterium dentium ATCC 27678]